jgi:hypothetical protein
VYTREDIVEGPTPLRSEKRRRLFELVATEGRYFTAAQARAAGYAPNIVNAWRKHAAAIRAAWDRIHGYGEKDGGKLK